MNISEYSLIGWKIGWPFYNDFAARFAACTITSLVETFNGQVGKRGFNSMRAAMKNWQKLCLPFVMSMFFRNFALYIFIFYMRICRHCGKK